MACGFALASKGEINLFLFLITLIGLGLTIASAGVFNNCIDRKIDAKMERTKNRVIPRGLISVSKALIFASILGIGGFTLLSFINFLTVFVAFIGFFIYLVLYAFLKTRSFYGTLVGSLAGAIPPVVGYCAVSNHFDLAAFLLFLIVLLWQMPHFFAIAIYRIEDYAAASIPVLPIEKGTYLTKLHMVFYILIFMIASLLLTVTGYTGYLYATVAILLSLSWLGLCLSGFFAHSEKKWARQMFVYSLVVIMGLCLTIPLNIQ